MQDFEYHVAPVELSPRRWVAAGIRVRRVRPPEPPERRHPPGVEGGRRASLPLLRPALVVSALVVAGALARTSPLVGAAAPDTPAGVSLRLSAPYVVLAPLSAVLDALTLLSVEQHLALIASVVVAHLGWRAARRRSESGRTSAAGEMRLLAATLASIVATYLAVALLPRPMGRLATADPDVVVVDFHSHTEASHDGRPGFDAEANRAWHRAAGFDVAYVSDHRRVEGALAGMRANPATAGAGTVLLPAVEQRAGGEHVVALGIDPYHGNPATGEWRAPARPTGLATGGESPMLVLTIPGRISRLARLAAGPTPVVAVEIADGCPRGIAQAASERAALLKLADSLDVATVAGSDNHGWGHTATAWSLMRIPGWRALPPDALGARIAATLVREHRAAVTVVARRAPAPAAESRARLALLAPELAWSVARELTWGERLSWLCWGWALPLAALLRRRSADAAAEPRRTDGTPEDDAIAA